MHFSTFTLKSLPLWSCAGGRDTHLAPEGGKHDGAVRDGGESLCRNLLDLALRQLRHVRAGDEHQPAELGDES